MTQRIHNLTRTCLVLLVLGGAAEASFLTRPPTYDGVWLIATLLLLAAMACAFALAYLTSKQNRTKQ